MMLKLFQLVIFRKKYIDLEFVSSIMNTIIVPIISKNNRNFLCFSVNSMVFENRFRDNDVLILKRVRGIIVSRNRIIENTIIS